MKFASGGAIQNPNRSPNDPPVRYGRLVAGTLVLTPKWTRETIAGARSYRQNNRIVRHEISSINVNEKVPVERRQSDRFAIEREVRYRVINKRGGEEAGEGKTVNMSSAGVLFTSDHLLIPGRRVELSVNWPALLNNKCALKLVARGRVVRFEEGRVAIDIQQYEFRTTPLPGGGTSVPPPAMD